MLCKKCNKDFSDSVYHLHIERCGVISENKQKKLKNMKKDELFEIAEKLEIIVEDKEAITNQQLIDLIKEKNSTIE